MQPNGVPVYAGGGSEEGRNMIATHCDHYLMHGGTVDKIAGDIEDLRERRAEKGHDPDEMKFGMAAYMICRDSEQEAREELDRITTVDYEAEGFDSYDDFVEHSELDSEVDLKDYSVSNRGLRPDLVGTPDQIVEKLNAYADVGLDLVLLQCSPMLEEVQRIGREVIPRLAPRWRAEHGGRHESPESPRCSTSTPSRSSSSSTRLRLTGIRVPSCSRTA